MKKLLPFPYLFLLIFLLLVLKVDAKEYFFVTLEYPPLEYTDKSGKPKGAAVEIVTTIMKELGHDLKIKILPWTRAVKMVRYGRADAIFTIFKNAERQMFLDYSKEVLIPQWVAFYDRKDGQTAYSGKLNDIKHLKVGVVSTISYGSRFDQARRHLNIESTATLEQNFKKLMLGRIDLVVSNVYSADSVINKLKVKDKIKQLQPPVANVPSYIAFSKQKKLTALQIQFDRKLIELKHRGTYNQIIHKSKLKIGTKGY